MDNPVTKLLWICVGCIGSLLVGGTLALFKGAMGKNATKETVDAKTDLLEKDIAHATKELVEQGTRLEVLEREQKNLKLDYREELANMRQNVNQELSVVNERCRRELLLVKESCNKQMSHFRDECKDTYVNKELYAETLKGVHEKLETIIRFVKK